MPSTRYLSFTQSSALTAPVIANACVDIHTQLHLGVMR